MTILLTFHTHEGQTQRIADRIACDLVDEGFDVDLLKVSDDPDPTGYQAVVVGTSVRFERHGRSTTRYLRRHSAELAGMPLALFQVSMTSARTDQEHVAKADQLVLRLLSRTGVHPEVIAKFAGALRYTEYGWVTKRVMRSIAEREGNHTDTSRDHEYTDWDAVDRFAADIVALVSAKVATS